MHQAGPCSSQCSSFNYDRPNLTGFFAYCESVSVARQESVFPDVIDWHSFPHHPNIPSDIFREAGEIKEALHTQTTYYLNADTLLSVSEAMGCEESMRPGTNLWALARAERAVEEGLTFMCRAVYDATSPETCAPREPAGQPFNKMNSLIEPDPESPYHLQPRQAWYLYRDYASIRGMYVEADSVGDFEVIAGYDTGPTRPVIIVGHRGTSGGALHLRLMGMDQFSGLAVEDLVHARVLKYSGDLNDAWPTHLTDADFVLDDLSHNYIVEDGVLEISIGESVFDGPSAISIVLSPPAPSLA